MTEDENNSYQGASPEKVDALNAVSAAETVVASHQERVRSIAAQLDAAAAAIDGKRQERTATGRALANGDPAAMFAGKRLAAEIEDLSRERDVLVSAHEAALADLKASEASLVAAQRRVAFEDSKDLAEEAMGIVEIIDELQRDFVKHAEWLQNVAADFHRKSGNDRLRSLVRNRHRFTMGARAAGLHRFMELGPVWGANRLSLTDQIGGFLKDWLASGGQTPAPENDGANPTDELPAGCKLSHRGMGRWFAYSADGTQVGGLFGSRADAIAALQAAQTAA